MGPASQPDTTSSLKANTEQIRQQRRDNLSQWIGSVLNTNAPELTVVSGDASFRRYFRFKHQGATYIAVDAPPDKENNLAFWQIGSLLASQKIKVPEFKHIDLEHGFIILSDLGDQLLLPRLTESNVDSFYRKAIDIIIQLQIIPVEKIADLPAYDEQKLAFELSLFETWFVNKHLGIQLTDSQQTIIDKLCKQLIERATKQNQRLTHRDFHSRNLMLTQSDELAVIDFQDAVIGPVSYDLVSLLKDCYISWPRNKVIHWLESYYQIASQQTVACKPLMESSFDAFTQDFDWMGLQRHLKVLGIFCRLNYRDNKPQYLKDLRLTYDYVKQVTSHYQELKDFDELLEQLIGPAFETSQ
ncbi:phosphotransferase [Aliikangiella marina]|uniref:Phosphotransferase n=1 Tax=Aliikangiella marina TaxID=1712262 RepID=A0A545TCA9_9GAMM|nr:phosphotransferase [Aliikangiella marina]TQV74852.1 phosphotransferase [Aliikangiella marina]